MEHDPEVMNICAVAYLEEVRRRKASLAWVREEYIQARDDFDELCSRPMPGHGPAIKQRQDGISKAYVILEERRDEMAREIVESMEFLSHAFDICAGEGLNCDMAEGICYQHYVNGAKWESLAASTGYSLSHIKTKVRPRGLARIYKRMPEEFRRTPIPNAEASDAMPSSLAKEKTK